ncbi:unnamed protein product [Hydatigera taeniaeformis]|uniref:Uncharacterized protein n=1 Tax=Hydatigena taeniaeformis TaxID=6205 RepID=A0A3P7GUA2_HYDTA|nr:unnamed protein product [Hydatigera taeniaeformis]
MDVSQSYDSVLNFEESVDKLVREDELEDPAILNVSKYGPGASTQQAIPVAPIINPNDIWGTGLPHNAGSNHGSSRFDPFLDLLSQQLSSDLAVSGDRKVIQGQTMEPPVDKSSDVNSLSGCFGCNKKEVQPDLGAPHATMKSHPPYQVRPLLGMATPPSEQLQKLLHATKGVVSPQHHFFNMPVTTSLQKVQPTPSRNGFFMVPSGPSTSYSRFAAPPPPLFSSLPHLTSSVHLQKPFPMPPKVSFLPPMQQLHPQHPLFAQFSPPSPLDPSRLSDILFARIEAEQPDKASFDPRFGAWMSPQDQLLVLNCQLRSLNVANPYVEVGFCSYFSTPADLSSECSVCEL